MCVCETEREREREREREKQREIQLLNSSKSFILKIINIITYASSLRT